MQVLLQIWQKALLSQHHAEYLIIAQLIMHLMQFADLLESFIQPFINESRCVSGHNAIVFGSPFPFLWRAAKSIPGAWNSEHIRNTKPVPVITTHRWPSRRAFTHLWLPFCGANKRFWLRCRQTVLAVAIDDRRLLVVLDPVSHSHSWDAWVW